jgi:hypothetical protein
MELMRQIDASTFQTKSLWDSDGRLQLATPWVGTSSLRDARQPVRHTSYKRWGGYPGGGQDVKPAPDVASTFTYTWAVMTSHSASAFDLAVQTLVEIAIGAGTTLPTDGQFFTVATHISINGGAFTSIGSQQLAGVATGPDRIRPMKTDMCAAHVRDIPAGATFQLRTVIINGNASPWLDLQAIDLTATECVIHNYDPPA